MARRLIDTSLQLLLLLTCVSLFDAMYILVLPQCWPAGKEERELSTGCCAVLIFLSLSECVWEREKESGNRGQDGCPQFLWGTLPFIYSLAIATRIFKRRNIGIYFLFIFFYLARSQASEESFGPSHVRRPLQHVRLLLVDAILLADVFARVQRRLVRRRRRLFTSSAFTSRPAHPIASSADAYCARLIDSDVNL